MKKVLGTKASDMAMQMVFDKEILGMILQVVHRIMEVSHGFGNLEHSSKLRLPYSSPHLSFSYYHKFFQTEKPC